MTKTKKLYLITVASFILANLVAYLLFHIPALVLEETYEWLEYTRVFLSKFLEFILPSVAGTVLFIGYREIGIKKTLLRALYISLPRIVYLLPYYYVYHIVMAYDSVESISLSALVTLFGIALFFGQALLLFFIIRIFSRMPIVKALKKELPVNQQAKTPKDVKILLVKNAEDVLEETKTRGSVFDFAHYENLGIFASVFTVFIVELIRELVDSIAFIIECEGNLFADEIIYMTACYLFLLVELLAGQAICGLIKNAALNKTNKKPKNDNQEHK